MIDNNGSRVLRLVCARAFLPIIAARPRVGMAMAAQPPTIHDAPADYWTDRGGVPVVAIVAHGTGGTNSLSTLQHGDGRGVSIHTLHPKDGSIYRLVPDERGANHAGAASSSFTLAGRTYSGGMVNRVTVGLEIENLQDGRDPYTPAQLLSAGFQIATWRRKFGPLPILRHADLDPTRRRDPYQLSVDDLERWTVRAMQAYFPTVSLPTKRYRVKVPMFWLEDRRADAPIANQGRALLEAGDVVAIDDITNGWAHAANGIGFTLMAGLEETQ